jgi:hypothetical protein
MANPRFFLVMLLLTFSLFLVGCSSSSDQTYLERAYAKEFEGTVVTICGGRSPKI